MEDVVNKAFQYALRFAAASTSYRAGMAAMKIAISIVFLWIGALKFVAYEADSITPFVANSPFMSFFYKQPKQYKQHLTPEGVLNPADRNWQTSNIPTPSRGAGDPGDVDWCAHACGDLFTACGVGRRIALFLYGFRHLVVSDYNSRGLGEQSRRQRIRLSISVRCGPAGLEGCHASGRRMAGCLRLCAYATPSWSRRFDIDCNRFRECSPRRLVSADNDWLSGVVPDHAHPVTGSSDVCKVSAGL